MGTSMSKASRRHSSYCNHPFRKPRYFYSRNLPSFLVPQAHPIIILLKVRRSDFYRNTAAGNPFGALCLRNEFLQSNPIVLTEIYAIPGNGGNRPIRVTPGGFDARTVASDRKYPAAIRNNLLAALLVPAWNTCAENSDRGP